jgi:hypothetical protein
VRSDGAIDVLHGSEHWIALEIRHLHRYSIGTTVSGVHLALHDLYDVRAPPLSEDLGVRPRVEDLIHRSRERAAQQSLGAPLIIRNFTRWSTATPNRVRTRLVLAH